MVTTLAQAKLNTQDAYDVNVIDEFRKSNALLDLMEWDQAVNPQGGGATLDYSYRRQKTQASASFRKINTEYTPGSVTTEKHTITLAELGGSYEIDRRIANLGPAATAEIALQTLNKVKAASALLSDSIINGDSAADEDSFDGLDKALTGSSTEITDGKDWSAFTDATSAMVILDDLDELQSEIDGATSVMIANKHALSKMRAAARRANMYVSEPVADLRLPDGRQLTRQSIGGVLFVDPGEKAGSSDLVIPVDATTGTTSIYAVRMGLDGFHGVTTAGGNLVRTLLPDFTTAGAVKTGEVYLENVAVVLKATRAAAVLRDVKVR
ncbi:major capsid protein [Corynebacterium glutamicum]|uniref:major capsid protein n=1 Tax=Corynebacterium glutamicum TaxID=1718 RepID=UPI000944C15A|nr:phage capsid protein [Corynebacterium glutamicum]OKX85126.1 phage capsid protein [Corynebacterium glutamicum]